MNNMRCTQCGQVGLEQGFVSDTGQGARGYARWFGSLLERGILGMAKTRGLPQWQIDAFRCPNCAHLELFAVERLNLRA
ncbi:hypothetical protein [Streptomyces sp. NPDC086182]|jgi:phage FluMu protein Com|uniref:hypothetical protein n=1 Tax=Streptomyces sp. NPDC086182 TaxID=3155058 RepID=UPI00343960DA